MEETFELVVLAGGVCSLRSTGNGQTFHPVVGPAAEAEAIHLAGTRLVERTNIGPGQAFTIWDVGLGAAANATAAIGALRAGYHGSGNINLLSFDRTTAALDFALENADALVYPRLYREHMQALRRDAIAEIPLGGGQAALRWSLHVADFPGLVAGAIELAPPRAVFFDPYSPTVNPEMWTLELFGALHARLSPDTPCLLTTYTRSTAVRVTLLLAGFYVGIGHATGEKDETTIAANDPALLERPLPRAWLESRRRAA